MKSDDHIKVEVQLFDRLKKLNDLYIINLPSLSNLLTIKELVAQVRYYSLLSIFYSLIQDFKRFSK